jgi:parallel beta-helix repeat protein
MRNKKYSIIGVLGLFFIFIIISNNIDLNNSNVNTNEPNMEIEQLEDLLTVKSSGFWNNFSSIYINNWTTIAGYDWCSGNGSWGNPYVIENMSIDAGGGSYGIFVQNSKNDYFIIRNVTVYNAGSGQWDTGIKLLNTNNGTLIDNNCSNNGNSGILLYNDSDNNTISGNTANNDGLYGIWLVNDCENNTISGNTANYNIIIGGIVLNDFCDNNTISGNTANNNADGIWLASRCSNNTISGNNVTNNNLNGINIYNNCHKNMISGNIANNNWGVGIYLYENCSSNTISGNTATNNAGDGIMLAKLTYPCNNNTISGNNVSYNAQNGINLYDGGNDNMIMGNRITNNTDDGIELYYSFSNQIIGNSINFSGDDGIYLDNSNWNNITGNRIINNTDNGIELSQSDSNQIIGNSINSSAQYGIWLNSGSDNNLMYNNMFNNNIVHARDDAGTNFWNNSVIGNYWDNYTWFDVNRDGIGDTPHDFIGGTDYLPKWTISNSNVSIDFPINNTICATPPLITIRTFHLSNHSNWYNVSGNPNIVFFLNNTQANLNISLWNSLPEGQFQISFYFNDTFGTIYENATYTLYKDSQAPNITLSSPSDGEYFNVAPPSYNVQFADQYPITMWYSLNNLLNITFTTNGTLDLGNWTAIPEGPVTLRFYAKDTVGNLHTSMLNIFKDTARPILELSAPTELQVCMDQAPEFDLTINDASPCIIWYSLNNGRNISSSSSGRIDAGEWDALPDGVIRIQFNVQDAAGNFFSIEIDVQKTSSNPLLIIIIVAVALAMLGVGLLARRSRIRARERDVKIVAFLNEQRSAITENDISLYKEQHLCLVHKGKIDGISYICPNCGSFYCMKCYDALVELENECWSCRNAIDVSKPVKTFKKDKSVQLIDDGIGKKGLLKSTKEVRKAADLKRVSLMTTTAPERSKLLKTIEKEKSEPLIDDGIEKKGLMKSTEEARKAADLKRASLMATTAPDLKEPIQKTPLESQIEVNRLKQDIDFMNKELEDLDIRVKYGIITEKKYLRKKELLETILNSLNFKLDQIKK